MKYLLGFSVFLIWNLNLAAQNFLIKGDVASDTSNGVILTIPPTDYALQNSYESCKIENGKFELKTDLKQMTEAIMIVGKTEIPMLIQPGDNLVFELIPTVEGHSIKWSGKGAANNLFFLNYIVHSIELAEKLQVSESFLSENPNRYRDLLNRDKQNRLDFVKNYRSEELGPPDEAAKIWVENNIRYDMARALVEYPKLYKKINPKGKKLKIPKDYYSFIGVVDFGRRDLLDAEFYRKFVLTWFNEYLVPTFKNTNNLITPKELINFADKKLTPGDSEYIQYAILHKIFRAGFNIEIYEKQYQNFQKSAKSTVAKAELQRLWEKFTFDYKGLHLPDADFLDENGDTVRLSDFEGKTLYIKFWATWCKPCIEEMPYTKELQAKFKKRDDLVFLYLSTEGNKEKWRNWLKKNKKEDDTVHVTTIPGKKDGLMRLLNIRAIPHSVIVDSDRRVAVYRAIWPGYPASDKELSRVLRSSD